MNTLARSTNSSGMASAVGEGEPMTARISRRIPVIRFRTPLMLLGTGVQKGDIPIGPEKGTFRMALSSRNSLACKELIT